MAAVNAGALEYKFSADIADIKAKLGEIRQQMQQLSTQAQAAGRELSQGMNQASTSANQLSQSVRSVASVWSSFARGFAIGLIVEGFRQAVRAVGDYNQHLLEMQQVAKRTYQDVAALSGLVSAGGKSGLGSSAVLSGLDSLGAKANTEFREGEGELTKLLEANNRKLTDRNGKLKSANDLLLDAAALVRDAGTEYDKIDIARVFGLTEDWVKMLEKGPEALREAQAEATSTGGALDRELAQRAQAFYDAWNKAWEDWKSSAKGAIAQAAAWLGDLISASRNWANSLSPEWQTALGIGNNQLDRSGTYQPLDGSEGNVVTIRPQMRNTGWQSRLSKLYEPQGSPTKIPTKGGGGDSGGAERQDAIERYLSQLQRSVELAKVEYETFGKSTAERLKAVNLVRAEEVARREGRDLTEDERKKIGQMSEEQARFNDLLERARDIQQAVKSLGDTFANAIDDWIVKGTKFKQVLANLAQSLASMALKGALTGDGPIGSLLGLGGKNGAMGGIFGAIFSGLFGGGKAVGGPVSPSKGYMVGENGPEWFQPNSAGSIIPNGAQSTAATGPKITIQQTFTADASPRELAQIAGQIKTETFNSVRMAIARGSM